MNNSLKILRAIPKTLLITAIGFILTACATPAPPLPPVAWSTTEQARLIIKERQQAITNVQARCKFTFTSAEGKSHSVDGAIVLDDAHRARLRLWKINQTLLDVTAIDDQVWVVASDKLDGDRPDNLDQNDEVNAPVALAAAMQQLLRFPDLAANAHALQQNTSSLSLPFDGGMVYFDRNTLTPKSASFTQPDAAFKSFTTQYADYDGLVWLSRLQASGEFGQLDLRFHDVEINSPLNPRAFKPPRRAKLQ